MVEGIVIKAYSGYYYVQQNSKIWTCRLRGKFRLEKQDVLVGDIVKLKPADDNTGIVYEVLPRRTRLLRPPVANVDQAIITFAVKNPEPNLGLLDRFLLLAEEAGIRPVICLNKSDLLLKGIPQWIEIYLKIGYPVLVTSVANSTGIEELKRVLKDKVSVFAGPSGVGKSSLLNALQPGLQLKTGEVSYKLKKGRHTTRHVELIHLTSGGLIADTPGFSSLHLLEIPPEQLVRYFPEMVQYIGACRFTSCSHNKEPNCAVKEAVTRGEISTMRYNSYLQLFTELSNQERRY